MAFENKLAKLNEYDREAVIVDDINVDFLCSDCLSLNKLKDVLNSYNFSVKVDFPTRIKGTSAICIDHCYVNLRVDSVCTLLVDTYLSEHRAVRIDMTCATKCSSAGVYRRTCAARNALWRWRAPPAIAPYACVLLIS